jgi:hypothetical protein
MLTAAANGLTDGEIKVRGFQALVDVFGDVNAERFIALVNREPRDYTEWRRRNLYLDGDLHAVAERARLDGARFEAARQPAGAV